MEKVIMMSEEEFTELKKYQTEYFNIISSIKLIDYGGSNNSKYKKGVNRISINQKMLEKIINVNLGEIHRIDSRCENGSIELFTSIDLENKK